MLVSQSLGGLLALHLASRRPDVSGVCSLAAPLWLEGLGRKVVKWAASGALGRLRTSRKLRGSDCRDPQTRAENPAYNAIPLRALAQLAAFMAITDAALPNVTQPVLVLHAREDLTAPVACATRIAAQTHAVRMRILERNYHLIAADVERDIVAAEVIDFSFAATSLAILSRSLGQTASSFPDEWETSRMRHVIAIDQGTASSTVLVLGEQLTVRGRGYQEFRQIYPQPGWVEHDPEDIWEKSGRSMPSRRP